MKTLIINLFGLDAEIFKSLSARGKREFSSDLIAFFISVFMSCIFAAEMFFKAFGGFSFWIFPVLLGWCVIIGGFEVKLLRGDFNPVFRLVVSVVLVVLIVAVTFTWLIRSDVEQTQKVSSQAELIRTDSIYEAAKSTRYTLLNERKNAQVRYHNSICIPEAHNILAGPIYDKKHAFCLHELSEIARSQSRLDSVEHNYYNLYREQRSFISDDVTPGFFIELRQLYNFISDDWLKISIFLVLAVFLLSLESIVFFSTIKKNRHLEYKALEEEKSKLIQSEQKTRINNEHKYQQKKIDTEHIVRLQQAEMDNLRFEEEIQLKKEYQKLNIALQDLRLQNSIVTGRNLAVQNGRINAKMIPMVEEFIKTKVLRDFSTPFIEVKEVKEVKEAKKTTEVGKTSTGKTTEIEIFSKDVKATTNFFSNLYYCSEPMVALCHRFYAEVNGDPIRYSKAIFDWCLKNIEYKKQPTGYKTARETFNSRSGVCGEMAVLFIALLKQKGLKSDYVKVEIDSEGKNVNHACAGVNFSGKYELIDIAYKEFGVAHQKWYIRSEEELYNKYRAWNQ